MRKGIGDMIKTIIALVIALAVIGVFLVVVIPALFNTSTFACELLNKVFNSIPWFGGDLANSLGVGECGSWIFLAKLGTER